MKKIIEKSNNEKNKNKFEIIDFKKIMKGPLSNYNFNIENEKIKSMDKVVHLKKNKLNPKHKLQILDDFNELNPDEIASKKSKSNSKQFEIIDFSDLKKENYNNKIPTIKSLISNNVNDIEKSLIKQEVLDINPQLIRIKTKSIKGIEDNFEDVVNENKGNRDAEYISFKTDNSKNQSNREFINSESSTNKKKNIFMDSLGKNERYSENLNKEVDIIKINSKLDKIKNESKEKLKFKADDIKIENSDNILDKTNKINNFDRNSQVEITDNPKNEKLDKVINNIKINSFENINKDEKRLELVDLQKTSEENINNKNKIKTDLQISDININNDLNNNKIFNVESNNTKNGIRTNLEKNQDNDIRIFTNSDSSFITSQNKENMFYKKSQLNIPIKENKNSKENLEYYYNLQLINSKNSNKNINEIPNIKNFLVEISEKNFKDPLNDKTQEEIHIKKKKEKVNIDKDFKINDVKGDLSLENLSEEYIKNLEKIIKNKKQKINGNNYIIKDKQSNYSNSNDSFEEKIDEEDSRYKDIENNIKSLKIEGFTDDSKFINSEKNLSKSNNKSKNTTLIKSHQFNRSKNNIKILDHYANENEDSHIGIRFENDSEQIDPSINSQKINEIKKNNFDYNDIIFPKYEMNEIKEAFDCFDLNLNGYISADEIKFIFGVLNEEIQNEEIDEMIKLADKEGHGQVSWEGFLKFITGNV